MGAKETREYGIEVEEAGGPGTEEGQIHPDLEVLLEEKGAFEHPSGDAGLGESDTFGLEHVETKLQEGQLRS